MAVNNEAGVVILGAGLAGYSVARALRKLRPDMPIVVVTDDDGHFYSKPALSASLSQRSTAQDLIQRSAEQMRAELGCTLWHRTRVQGIDVARRTVNVEHDVLPYTELVLALGAKVRLPPVPGLTPSARVLSVQHLDDYRRLTQLLEPGCNVAVLGAGLVGCELANDLRRAGYGVTLMDRAEHPLPSLVPAAVGRRLRERLEAVGVISRFGVQLEFVDSCHDRVEIGLGGNDLVVANILICATGQTACDELAQQAGLRTQQGVVVDRRLRSSNEHVFAIGDCARLTPYNLNFVAPIARAAKVLANSLIGMDEQLSLPALPVVVKTPCFPLVISAGPRDSAVTWAILEDDTGITAVASNASGQPFAFALGGTHVADRDRHLKELPSLV